MSKIDGQVWVRERRARALLRQSGPLPGKSSLGDWGSRPNFPDAAALRDRIFSIFGVSQEVLYDNP